MTKTEFLKAFAAHVKAHPEQTWHLRGNGALCTVNEDFCPIEAVAGMRFAFATAGPQLGLIEADIESIVDAADDQPFRFSPAFDSEFRLALLQIAGVSE